MPLRLQKKAARVARAVVEEFNVARGVGARTDKRGNAKTSLWDHGKVRRGKTVDRWMRRVCARGGGVMDACATRTRGIDCFLWCRANAQAKIVASTVDKEFANAQTAFTKATNFDDVPPKEKHVQYLIAACGAGGSPKERVFVLEAIARQIRKCSPWRTMLKTHVLLHRLLRECRGEDFKGEFFRFLEFLSRKTYGPKEQTLFNIRYWKDEANRDAYELTGWTRAYAAYLEELCALNAYVPCLIGGGGEQNRQGVVNPLKDCDFQTLLKVMPLLQTLVRRITDCDPKSSVLKDNAVSRFAVSLVVKDSFVVYRVMNEAIINLVEKYFDSSKVEAMKGLEIFKKYLSQIEDLQRFYDACDGCGAFENGGAAIKLEAPPATFLQSMVEYCESAPREGLPLRERRMMSSAPARGSAPATAATPPAQLMVDIPQNNPDLITPAALPPPQTQMSALDALNQLSLGSGSTPQASVDVFAAAALPPPTEPLALPPAAPTTTTTPSSTNTLDPFAALPPAPAPAPAAAPYANNQFVAPQPQAPPQYQQQQYQQQYQQQQPSPRQNANPFGDNPFGAPPRQELSSSALDELYAKAPPSPTGGQGMNSMVPPQYINQSYMQQPPPQRLQAQASSPQLALPMAGMQYPQYPGGAQPYPQYGRPPSHPGLSPRQTFSQPSLRNPYGGSPNGPGSPDSTGSLI